VSTVTVRRIRPLVALAVVALLATLLATPAPAQASGSAGDHETDFVQRTNAERSSRGVSSLRVASDLTDVARRHSAVMARDSHLHHNPNLASDVSGWTRIGENVGRGGSVSSLHSALMNSEGHRRNILDANFSEIGIGVVVSGSTIWVTQVFRLPNGTVSTATTFRDVNGGTHAGNIDRLYKAGITTGCTSRDYCPTDSVTRAQMATFLTRAMDLTPLTTRLFRDLDPSGVHTANIGALADAGVTSGCESGLFCPERSITRAQMATFLANALNLDTSSSKAQFSDVPSGGVHNGAINAIAAEGITKGCGSGRYCPNQSVTRAEMASFLVRAFDL
jgi:uncharacterized protein YkwD